MRPRACEIAQYVVNHFLDTADGITNIKLNRLLYLMWIEYYRATGLYLFTEMIYSWPLGPCITEVNRRYAGYGGGVIFDRFAVRMPDDVDTKLLDEAVKKYGGHDMRQLCDMTRHEGGAWDYTYKIYGKRGIIGYDLIVERDCAWSK